jgi:hypothetical protein
MWRKPEIESNNRTGSHRIAQDRTMQLFDYDLQIDYWRNGRVEMRPWFYEMRSYEAGIRLFYFDGFSGFRAHPVRLVQGRTATMASLLTSRSLTWRRVTRVEQCERAAHLLGGRAPEKRVSSRKLQSTGESHGTNPHALAKTNPTVWMGRSCEGPCKRDPVENESTGRIPLQSAPDGTPAGRTGAPPGCGTSRPSP